MLPPPVSTTVRVLPTASQSPVWSRTALIGGMGPYHRWKRAGSGIGTVPPNAACTETGIARDCSTTIGCAMMGMVPPGTATRDERERHGRDDEGTAVLRRVQTGCGGRRSDSRTGPWRGPRQGGVLRYLPFRPEPHQRDVPLAAAGRDAR